MAGAKTLQIQVDKDDMEDDEVPSDDDGGARDHLLPSQHASDKRWNRQRWISIYVMFFTMFLSAATFSIVLSSLWPYLLEIDAQTSTKFLGWVVAAYSIGQLVASPLLGGWADYRPAWQPLVFSLLINIIFSLLYCFAGAFPQNNGVSGWVVLISRAFIGFGAGNAAIVRSYVSEATTEKERNGAMAGVSGFQAIGFIAGPALGLAFVPLGAIGLRIAAIKFVFNMYTGPAFLGGALGVVNIVLLATLFRTRKLHSRAGLEERKLSKVLNGSGVRRLRWSSFTRPKWDSLAATVSILLFFIVLFVFAVFETIGTPLTMDEFAWTNNQAVLYNNLFYAGLAVIAIATFVVIKIVTKWVDDRVVFMVALFIVAFGFFVLIPMGDDYPALQLNVINGQDLSPERNISPFIDIEEASKQVGCRYPLQRWCTSVPRIYLFQYTISMVLIAVGYPAASVMCYAIFSKILGPHRQGTMMGLLTASGSLARSLGPIFVSHLYQHTGPAITFASVDAVVALGIVLLLAFSYRLTPYKS